MIVNNKAEFEKMNILKWREAGYTGKGSVVVVLDTPHKPYPHTNVNDPFNNNNDSYGHKGQVAQVIREIAPGADITVFSWTKSGKQEIIDWIKAHESEIDVINVSLAINTSIDLFKQLEQFDIPVIVSSGNGSKSKIQSVAAYPWTIAVGAWQENNDRKASYSNYGTNLDGVAYTNIYITTTSTTMLFNGTSCSAPVTSSLIKIYNEWRKENGLKKMTRNEARDFLHKYALDKNGEGYDLESGWGLFRLPSEVPILPKPEAPKEEPKPEPEKPEEVVQPMAVKLIIDAGHGGEDTGGYSGGYREKDLTLPVARRVKELLKNWNPAITRTEDTLLIWNNRAAMIKDQYDYCISVHFNIGGGIGVEAIHSHLSLRGKQLATILVDEVSTNVGIPKRRTPVFSKKQSDGQDYYYMHRLTGRTCTVILEVFFLDNDADKMYMNLEKIAKAIATGFTKFLATQTVFTPPTAMNPRTLRQYNSDIHVYETKPGMKVDVDLGTRFKLERVSSIMKDKLAKGEKILAGINGGFFNLDGSSEHLGMLIDEGLYYQVPSINFVDFIYYKNGKTEIRNMHGYDKAELSRLQAETHWAIGTSYALVVDGKINLMLADKFAHSKSKEPRTMIGQKADGTFVLVVTDGRVKDSAGLTATEQAELMLSLGCINAVNLDGGGSSTMVINRHGVPVVFNELYDGFERSVGSVILVKEA